MKKHKKAYITYNVVVVFCTKMSYNYEKVSLSGNKNDQVIHHFRIIYQVTKSQVYLIQGVSFN